MSYREMLLKSNIPEDRAVDLLDGRHRAARYVKAVHRAAVHHVTVINDLATGENYQLTMGLCRSPAAA
jgi:hypothetical protein